MFGFKSTRLKDAEARAAQLQSDNEAVRRDLRHMSETVQALVRDKEAQLDKNQAAEFDDFCQVGEGFIYLNVDYVVIENLNSHIRCHYMHPKKCELDVEIFNYKMLKVLYKQAEFLHE